MNPIKLKPARIRFIILILFVWCSADAQRPAYTLKDLPVVLEKLKTMPDDSSKIWYALAAAQMYMLKDGELRSDLDSAVLMIREADRLNSTYGIEKYQLKSRLYRCLVYMEDQQWVEGRKIIQELDKQYDQNGDKYNQAIALMRYSMYLNPTVRELTDEKRTLLRKASRLFGETGAGKRQLSCELMLADQQMQLGQTDSALMNVTPILREYLATDNTDVLRAYGVIIEIHKRYGNTDEVLKYAHEALAYCEKKGQKHWGHSLYTELGDAYSALQNYSKAEEWYKLYLDESKANFRGRVYYGLHKLINTMLKLGKVDPADELLTNIVAEFPTQDGVTLERIAFCRGRIYEHQKKFTLAEKQYRIAVSPLSGIDDPSFRDDVSKFYFSQRKYAEAKLHAKEVLEYQLPLLTQTKAYFNLYRADSALGNYHEALKALRKYTDLQAVISAETKVKQAEYLAVKYETQKKDQDLAFKNQSIELLTAQSQGQRNLQRATWIGVLLLVIILLLIYRQFRLSKVNNRKLLARQADIDQKNETLQHLLKEKEWLLKEIHHRVKNNLQTIVSLLESQSRYIQNSEALSAITDSQNRVNAMSIIHQKLFQGQTLAEISVLSYFPELIQYLRDSFETRSIHFETSIEQLDLDVTQAVPIGLIINEAITNSIKYAFPVFKEGQKISITLTVDSGNQVTLVIQDNGVGLPQHSDNTIDDNGLGIKLMRGLTKDIDGSFRMTSDLGLKIEITFTAIAPLSKGVAA